tara:strand:- start:7780 stop:8181 length:402 start_codon:yes stop_codon:yes gene_type:complete
VVEIDAPPQNRPHDGKDDRVVEQVDERLIVPDEVGVKQIPLFASRSLFASDGIDQRLEPIALVIRKRIPNDQESLLLEVIELFPDGQIFEDRFLHAGFSSGFASTKKESGIRGRSRSLTPALPFWFYQLFVLA